MKWTRSKRRSEAKGIERGRKDFLEDNIVTEEKEMIRKREIQAKSRENKAKESS